MAITELVFPTSGTPTVPTDYAYQNGYLAQNAKGYNAVSLTNWDTTTTAPQVASGSAIEINGATWQVDANTAILTTAATSGTNYLVFDDDAGAFGWDDGTPVWSATLNGWYIAGDRFTGHVCTWDGASAFSNKRYFNESKQGTAFGARSLFIKDGDATQGEINYLPADVGNYVFFEPGLLHLYDIDNNTSAISGSSAIVYYYDGSGYTIVARSASSIPSGASTYTSATLFSNGDNYCAYYNTAFASGGMAFRYTKII